MLETALEAPEGTLEAVLDDVCDENESLRRTAVEYLRSRDRLDGFMDRPLWTPGNPGDPEPGERFGPYRIEELLGRGGMGTVYRATREEEFEQHVAIKLIRRVAGRSDIIRRFHNERQILARLEHPHIARLLDGGTTPDGVPFFVMEYVDGEPIDRYCDARQLALDQRLEVFLKVCSAVQMAHQNLVVHRDLKPGNILVTADGMPKLLDFGIAKLLDEGRPEGMVPESGVPENVVPENVVTVEGRVPMTPHYASPEQVLGEAITIASDVYALGVVLYQLLVGQLPYEIGEQSYRQLVRTICHDEVPRPSVRATRRSPTNDAVSEALALKEHARLRGATSRRLRHHLAGDLDAIVLKALCKKPTERYGTVERLAADIRRYLGRLPVEAQHSTWWYRTSKFLRRHKWLTAMAMLVLIAAVVSTVMWRRAAELQIHADHERGRAQSALTLAEASVGFLKNVLTSANPDVSQGRDLTVREVIEDGRAQLDTLGDQPALQAEMFSTFGEVYRSLGDYPDARVMFEQAIALRRELFAEPDATFATDVDSLAGIHYYLKDPETAERIYREALTIWRAVGDEESEIGTMASLASTLRQSGHDAQAEAMTVEVLNKGRQVLGDSHPFVIRTQHGLGTLLYERREFASAEHHLRDALSRAIEVHGDLHSVVASLRGTLGRTLHAVLRLEEARQMLEAQGVVRRQLYGAGSVSLARSERDLAAVLLEQGDREAAAALIESSRAVFEAAHGSDHWTVAEIEGLSGFRLALAGHTEDAEPRLLTSYQALVDVRGEGDMRTRQAARRIALSYRALGRPEAAATYDRLSGLGTLDEKAPGVARGENSGS